MMPPWLRDLLVWLKDNAAWLVSAWAVWIAVRGRRFDAKRAYSEFVLKQRIDAATALMRASVRHVSLLADIMDSRARIDSGQLLPGTRTQFVNHVSRRFDEMQGPEGTLAKLDEANATATAFFSRHLLEAVGRLAAINVRATASAQEYEFDEGEARKALGSVLDTIQKELNIDGVINYQNSLFKRR